MDYISEKSFKYKLFRTCTRKSKLTQEDADRIITNNVKYNNNKAIHKYKCPYCGYFHLTKIIGDL